MPFPMTHLCIAEKILDNSIKIDNSASFILGSIAPDAVHFRDDYSGDTKKTSHICNINQRWGEVTDNEKWMEDVLIFLDAHKDSEDKCFYYGYCVHILSDILWNINIWTPYRMKCIHEIEKFHNGDISSMHIECNEIDYILHKENEALCMSLKNNDGFCISDIINSTDIEKIKDNLLNHQYKNREEANYEEYKVITLDETKNFIKVAANRIIKIVSL